MIKEVAFVAIAISDKERARKFYQETLELRPSKTAMEGAWVEYDIGPVTIGVGSHPAWQPSRDGTSIAFEVDDLEKFAHEAAAKGYPLSDGPHRTEGGSLIAFIDAPEGYEIELIQRGNDL